MMGHREELKGGTEYDHLTKARRFYHTDKGRSARTKTKFNRRIRRDSKVQLKVNIDE